jgi:hypothetical protein
MVRGLIHHHGLAPVYRDGAVQIDWVRPPFPLDLVSMMTEFHAEPDILNYQYAREVLDAQGHSVWLLCFFERTHFLAVVSKSTTTENGLEVEGLTLAPHHADSRSA